MVGHEMSSVTCIVRDCFNSSISSPGKSFFKISVHDERCQHWLRVCRREDLLEQNYTGDQHFAVCSDHFIGDYFENSSRTKLVDYAVPTIFPKLMDSVVSTVFPECELYSSTKADSDKGLGMQVGTEVSIKTEPEDADDEYEEDDDNSDDDMEEQQDVKHPGQLCRLCASAVDDAIYIFSGQGLQLGLADKINANLPVMVKENDPLPKQLCTSCMKKVDMCQEFADICIEAENKLYTILKLKNFRSRRLDTPCEMPSRRILDAQCATDSGLKGDNGCKIVDTTIQAGICVKRDCELLAPKLEVCDLLTPKHENTGDCSDVNEDAFSEKLENCDMYSCPLCCKGNIGMLNAGKKRKLDYNCFGDFFLDSASEHSLKNSCSKLYISSKDSVWSEDENAVESADLDSSNTEDQLQDKFVYEVMNESGSNYTVVDSAAEWWNSGNLMDSAEIIIETVEPSESKDTNGDILIQDGTVVKVETEEGSVPFCCICGQIFTRIELCLDHSKIHYQTNHYPCSVCGKSFTIEQDLTEHHKQHSFEENKIKQKGKRLTCNSCGRRFNTKRTFINHSCITPEAKQFRCAVCKKSYSSEERLAFHQKFHEGARLNYCEQCGKEFDNEGSLYYHTRMVHEGERPFSCNMCTKKFYSNARLLAHKRVHTGERPFECEVCGRRFYDRETLKGHYVTHMSVKPFQCDLCGMCWGRKSMLNQHLRTHHSDLNSSDSHQSRRVPSLIHYYCKLCSATFTSSSDVLTHRATHWYASKTSTGNEQCDWHVCEYCGESFSVMSALGKHRKDEHPNEQPYVCSICKETSHTLYEARTHRKTHIEHEPKEKVEDGKGDKNLMFICEACGNIFTEKRKFVRHLKEHKAGKPYQCKVCGKEFMDNPRLTVHMRQHTGEKPYTCTVCNKRFTQTSALYTHALLHTGEKPHSCDLCGKAFRIKADRDNHRRTHTGEKPYKCEFCAKTFRTGQVYYQHRMIHTGERRFPCDVCGKAFKRSHTLVVHKRIHTGEKPNICDVCGKGFRQRSDMRKHRSLHGPLD